MSLEHLGGGRVTRNRHAPSLCLSREAETTPLTPHDLHLSVHPQRWALAHPCRRRAHRSHRVACRLLRGQVVIRVGARLDVALARRQRKAAPLGRFVAADGCRLRYRDLGQGPVALVFAPDPPNVLEHHEEAFRMLAQHVRVIGIELPGFGQSIPRKGFRFSIEDNRDVLLAALEALGVERAVLCLSCVAGLVSIAAAAAQPDRIRGVVAIQTGDLADTRAWAKRVDPRGILHTPVLGQAVVRATRRRIAAQWYRVACGNTTDVPHMTETALTAFDRRAAYALASGLQGLATVDAARLLPRLDETPALAIWGSRDRTHKRTNREGLRRYLPRIEMSVLDDAGHFPELEMPHRFRDEVLSWLTKTKVS